VVRDSEVRSVGLSRDAVWVAAGTTDGSVYLWDSGNGGAGRLVMRLGAHTDRTGALLFDAGGKWLASGGWDGRVVFFELTSLDRSVSEFASEARQDWLGASPAR